MDVMMLVMALLTAVSGGSGAYAGVQYALGRFEAKMESAEARVNDNRNDIKRLYRITNMTNLKMVRLQTGIMAKVNGMDKLLRNNDDGTEDQEINWRRYN